MDNYEKKAVKIQVLLDDCTVMELTGADASECWNRIDVAEWTRWASSFPDYKPLDWKEVKL